MDHTLCCVQYVHVYFKDINILNALSEEAKCKLINIRRNIFMQEWKENVTFPTFILKFLIFKNI